MFKNLANLTKINGGNNPSIQNTTEGTNNNTLKRPSANAPKDLVAHPGGVGEVQKSGGPSAPQQGARPANPFSKGLAGVRSEQTFTPPPLKAFPRPQPFGIPAAPVIASNTTNAGSPSTATSTRPVPGEGSSVTPMANRDSSSIEQQPIAKTSSSVQSPSRPDTSFDLFMASDELALADLMDELDDESNRDALLEPKPNIMLGALGSLGQDRTRIENGKTLEVPTILKSIKQERSSGMSAHQHTRPGPPLPSQQSPSAPPTTLLRTERATSMGAIIIRSPSNPPSLPSITSARSIQRSSSAPRIIAVNSQEKSIRPDAQDTIANSRPRQHAENKSLSAQGLRASAGGVGHHTHPSAPVTGRGRRRLPGPAGNLPALSAEEKEQLFRSRNISKDFRIPTTNAEGPSDSSIKKKMKGVSSGPQDSMFANGAWGDMLKAFGLPDYKPSTLERFKGTAPMIAVSLSDIMGRRDSRRGKIDLLVVMIKEFSVSEMDAAAMFLDPSGEMPGTMHRQVLEEYKNNEIRVGTVLALKDVSIFSLGPKSIYLNVTLRNIIGMFQPLPLTIILSQGSSPRSQSSQDRIWQRKRKLADTQESQSGQSSTPETFRAMRDRSQLVSSSPIMDEPPQRSTKARQPSTDWPDIEEDEMEATGSGSATASLNAQFASGVLEAGSAESSQQNQWPLSPLQRVQSHGRKTGPTAAITNPSQERVNKTPGNSQPGRSSPLNEASVESFGSQELNQEIQFQSLKPALNFNTRTNSDGRTEATLTCTPMDILGTLTPMVGPPPPSPLAVTAQTVAGRASLAAFAAAPSLRKRSSPTLVRQRTHSGLDSISLLSCPPLSPLSGPPAPVRRIVSPQAITAATTTAFSRKSQDEQQQQQQQQYRRAIDRQNSSSDWPDDLGEVDFGTGSDPILSPQGSGGRGAGEVLPQETRRPETEDDLEDGLLWGGLDETELFDDM